MFSDEQLLINKRHSCYAFKVKFIIVLCTGPVTLRFTDPKCSLKLEKITYVSLTALPHSTNVCFEWHAAFSNDERATCIRRGLFPHSPRAIGSVAHEGLFCSEGGGATRSSAWKGVACLPVLPSFNEQQKRKELSVGYQPNLRSRKHSKEFFGNFSQRILLASFQNEGDQSRSVCQKLLRSSLLYLRAEPLHHPLQEPHRGAVRHEWLLLKTQRAGTQHPAKQVSQPNGDSSTCYRLHLRLTDSAGKRDGRKKHARRVHVNEGEGTATGLWKTFLIAYLIFQMTIFNNAFLFIV